MNELHQGEFRITSENDIVMARKVVRDAATPWALASPM
jgi:hypothetical protein